MRSSRFFSGLAVLLFALAPAMAHAQGGYMEGLIKQLKDPDARARGNAAFLLGKEGDNAKSAVRYLIETLNDSSEAVRSEAAEALEKITKANKAFGKDKVAWEKWMETEGKEHFATSLYFPTKEEVNKLREDLDAAKQSQQLLVIFIAVVGLLFLGVIIYFTSVGSSRLKMWKETIKQADAYIKESAQITKRTDRILDELESKKTEILEFFTKMRADKETEIERFSELLEQNIEHRLREAEMGLREKAEKEIDQTLSELKAQVNLEIKKMMAEHRDVMDGDLKVKGSEFSKEAESQTLFLQASFYAMNGKYEDALKQYRKLHALKPNHYLAWTNVGNIHRDQSRFDRALEAYHKALESAPDSSMVLYNVAATYARMRRKDKMLESLRRAFQNDGDEYKDEALNDPAFKDYWSDPAFKDLVEV